VKDEDFTVFLEDFTDMLTELEAAVAKMKQQIARLVGVAEAKTAAAAQTLQPQTQKEAQLTGQEQLERVKQIFGELAGYLTFTAAEGKVVVRARQFLSNEVFSKVANITRTLGGRYISAGKESHFEIPLQ